ncbi:MAG TPA: helix-turn-helix domain-containing protein [Caulobacteraceae bacterium]|jgi:DNA-binding IscR family transcriptional regulator
MNAHLSLDRYIIETLLPDLVAHDRKPSAFLVYLVIAAAPGGRIALSHSTLAERAGISRRAAQSAVAHLARRGLIEIHRRGPTETSEYRVLTPWRRG